MPKHHSGLTRIYYPLVTLLLLFLTCTTQAQDKMFTATVDRQEVSSNETLTLRVRYAGQVQSGEPDFSLLQQDFEVISRRRSNQISTINGNMSAFTEWTLTIAPKRTGTLLIPSFKHDGYFTEAIQITVNEPSNAPDELRDVYIETEIDDAQVYVQQQVLLTYRLYTTRSIDSLDAEALSIDGVNIEELPQTRYHRRINGKDYGVLEVRYAIFPLSSQSFTIPSLNWTLRIVTDPDRRGFGFGTGRYELRRISTEEQQVKVSGQPAAYPRDELWLPASDVKIREEWSRSPSEFQVGEPITRTIRLEAEGLTAAQLPPLAENSAPPGMRFYPDQADQENRAEPEGMTGIRTEGIAIVPSRGGEMTLPPVQVSWWDTDTDELRTAELPAKTIFVHGGGADESADSEVQPDAQAEPEQDGAEVSSPKQSTEGSAPGDSRNFFWPSVALLFALLAGVFALLWWRQHQGRHVDERNNSGGDTNTPVAGKSEKQAFANLKHAHGNGDLRPLRTALLHWGSTRWPDKPPRSLYELSNQIDDEQIESQLMALDARLYGGKDAAFDGNSLVEALEHWRQQVRKPATQTQRLRPLY